MIEFWKYHGIGNDFVVIDGTKADPGLTPEQIAFLCDRNFGIGSDGVIYVNPGMDGSDVTMRIFNTDGTEPEMCGNGVRCLAKHAYDFGIVKSPDFVIHTGKGNLGAHCTLGADGKVDSVRIDMGAPILDPPSVPVKGDGDRVIDREIEIAGVKVHINAVSMGNPHCVMFDDLSDEDVERLGPIIEAGRELFPNKVNVEFAKVTDGKIDIRVFERGVGWTLACGTGACATTTAAALNGLVPFDEPVPVHLPGGDLRITVSKTLDRVLMDGPARLVYRGEIEL
ncbi:MAG: diaminopimelate epimerase [Candidatus Methanomethylophilaceae archaeon]|nr:diaminopimelate epimerase [Candidatus Methanomethylophilaceae archaeon]MDY5871894.1 diaminopimelate epimerase [Candidatus Methanomethylophilaceae archaeon]